VKVCSQTNREQVIERYLIDSLGKEEQESFEDHYFSCDECFAALQAHRALQAELAASASVIRALPISESRRWHWATALVAAAVVIIAVLSIRWGFKPASSSLSPTAQVTESAPAPNPLVDLARFDPPAYLSPALRGTQGKAARDFQDAMKHYQQHEYDVAAFRLRKAANRDPKDAGAAFFLGISYLMSGQDAEGIGALQQCVAIGDTPYLEEAHYYLAKAFLKTNDLTAAQNELQKVIQLRGDLLHQAEELLRKIQKLDNKPR
jgi:tetratricopeptide (TPR) repeat protein